MGTWGYETLENDYARDWLNTLGSLAEIEILFTTSLNNDQYIELPEASICIAGAEVVANLIQKIDITDSKLSIQWEKLSVKEQQNFIDKAKNVVCRVLEESELKTLWEESNDYGEWTSCIESLINRLNINSKATKDKKLNLLRFKFRGDSHIFKGATLVEIFESLYQENFRLWGYSREEYIVDMINRCQLSNKVDGKKCSPEELIQVLTANKILVQIK